jgi:hypothetical protein
VHEGRKKKTELAQKFSSGGPICDVTNRKLILPSRDDFFSFCCFRDARLRFREKVVNPVSVTRLGEIFASWAIVYLGQVMKMTELAHIFRQLFPR